MFAIMQRYRRLKPSIVVCSVVVRNICCSEIAQASVFFGFANMQLQLHTLQAIMQMFIDQVRQRTLTGETQRWPKS